MIKFEIPFSGDAPRAAHVIYEKWQQDIEKILKEADIDEITIRYQKTGKKIFIGEIEEQYTKTPIENFKEVIEFFKSEKEHFEIYTNDPQVIELFEVLYGEKNIDTFLISNNETYALTFQQAYDYLGDLYNIINDIRFDKQLNSENDDNEYFRGIDGINKALSKYERKWSNLNTEEKEK